jgi:hypothetical protein
MKRHYLHVYVQYPFDNITTIKTEIVRRGLLSRLNRQASPGLPFIELGYRRNKDILESEKGTAMLLDFAARRLFVLSQGVFVGKLSPYELVCLGLTDITSVFLKNEPHPLKKVQEGRFRLINSSSVVDQIVDAYYLRDYMDMSHYHYAERPFKAGMGLNNMKVDEFTEGLRKCGVTSQLPSLDSDVSGWDWCFTWWMFVYLILSHSASFRENRPMFNVMVNRMWMIYNRVIAFSPKPGTYASEVVVPEDGFGMASGVLYTAGGNSTARCFLEVLSWIRISNRIGRNITFYCITMGDDCVSFLWDWAVLYKHCDPSKELYEEIRKLGLLIKGVTKREGVFHFCSHEWSLEKDSAVPLNPAKAVANYFLRGGGIEKRLQLFELLNRHPEREEIIPAILAFEQRMAQGAM